MPTNLDILWEGAAASKSRKSAVDELYESSLSESHTPDKKDGDFPLDVAHDILTGQSEDIWAPAKKIEEVPQGKPGMMDISIEKKPKFFEHFNKPPQGWMPTDITPIMSHFDTSLETLKQVSEQKTKESPYAASPWSEVYARAQVARDYIMTLGGRIVPKGVDAKKFRQQMEERTEQFTGLGSLTVPATAETTEKALEWAYLYPMMFRAATPMVHAVNKLPIVQKATQAIERMGGLKAVSEKFPRTYQGFKNAVEAMESGAAVGGTIGTAEALSEGMTAGESVKHIGKEAATMGLVSGTFSVVSSIDKTIYINKLRSAMTERLDSELKSMMSQGQNPKSLTSFRDNALKTIDNITSSVEADLHGMTEGDLYKNIGGGRVEDPKVAAERFLKYGYKPLIGKPPIQGVESLKTGLGKTEPTDVLRGEPITKAEQVAEAVKHPIRTVQDAVKRVGDEMAFGKRGVAVPTEVPTEPVQMPVPPPVAAPAVETHATPAVTPPAAEAAESAVVDLQGQIEQYRAEAQKVLEPGLFESWQFKFDQQLERGYTPDEAYKAADEFSAERAKESKPKQGELWEGPSTTFLDDLYNQVKETPQEQRTAVDPVQATPAEAPPKEPWEMTKGEFYSKEYYQHSIFRKDAKDIGPEGFQFGIGPNAIRVTQGQPTDIMEKKYGTKAGVPIYLIPKEAIVYSENGPKVKVGFVPTQKLTPTRDYQPVHEMIVQQALSEGKVIPPAILAEYPELKQPTQPVETVQTTPPETAQPKETKQPWEMTKGEFQYVQNKPIVDAIIKKLESGGKVEVRTQFRITPLSKPEHIRITKNGDVQTVEGRGKWVNLTQDQIYSLGSQAGLSVPAFNERVYHRPSVEGALSEGKSVPENVLAEYPELKTTGPAVQEEEISDADLIGKYLSDQKFTVGLQNKVLGEVRKKIWEHPVVQSMNDLFGKMDEFLVLRVSPSDATDIREQVNAIHDDQVRNAVKAQISYAGPNEKPSANSPDLVAERISVAMGGRIDIGSNDVVGIMEMVKGGAKNQGAIPEVVRNLIRKSGDPYGQYLIRLENKVQSFPTVGELDRYIIGEMEDMDIDPSGYIDELWSYQSVTAAKIAKIKDPEKRKEARRRAAVLRLMRDQREKAEKEAADLLKKAGFTGITIEVGEEIEDIKGALPEHPGDEIPFETRGDRPVGVFLNRKGQEIIGFVYGADEFTGSHEFYHWAEGRLPKSDQEILKRGISRDREVRADRFAQYRFNQKNPENNLIKSIFDKIMRMIERLRNLFAGRGFRSYQDIFFELSEGKAKLNQSPIGTPAYSRKAYQPSENEIQAEMDKIEGEISKTKKRQRPKILAPKKETPLAKRTGPLFPGEIRGAELASAGGATVSKVKIPMSADTGTPALAPDIIPVMESGAPGTPLPPRPSVGPQSRPWDWYEGNMNPAKIPFREKLDRVIQESLTDVSKVLSPISWRIEKVSPEMFRMTRGYMQNRMFWQVELLERVVPYIKLTRKLPDRDQKILNMALMMGDRKIVDQINAKIPGAIQEYDNVREVLDEIFQQASDRGLDMNYQDEFWPRLIKDQKGLAREFGHADWDIIHRAVSDVEETKRRVLSDEEKNELITNLFFTGKIGKYLSRSTDPTKPRRLADLPGNIIRHYHDYGTGLMLYIDQIVDKIAKREFFNRMDPTMNGLLRRRAATTTRLARLRSAKPGPKASIDAIGKYNNRLAGLVQSLSEINGKIRNVANADTKDTLGLFFANLSLQGKIDEVQQRDLVEAVMALFQTRQTHPAIKAFMNLTYVDVLDSPIRALSNLQDLGIAYSRTAPYATKALLKVLSGKDSGVLKSTIAMTIGSEFQTENLYSATRQLLGTAGWGIADRMGKKVLVETILLQYQAMARKGKPPIELWQRVSRHVGPADTAEAIQDLKTGKITDIVRTVMFGELCDVQPMTMLERPEWYVRNPNGRMLYMLRGVTLRQLNYAIKEAHYAGMKGGIKGKIDAFIQLLRIAFWMTLFGGSIGMIKAIFRGQEIKDVSPYFVDGLLQYLLIFNRYTPRKLEEEGVSGVVSDAVIPPFQFWDAVARDLMEEDPEKRGEITKSVPVIGDMYYWWFGRGKRKQQEKEEESFF